MAKVKNHNGEKNSTVEGMAKYSFLSSPTSQFEHVPAPGEQRVMSVTVECKSVSDEKIDEGVRKHVKWKVIEAEIGSVAQRAPEDPQLPYESGANAEYGDYGVAAPPSSDGPDDEIGEDGYTNAERKAAAEGDTPTTATDSDGGKIVRPSFSGAK